MTKQYLIQLSLFSLLIGGNAYAQQYDPYNNELRIGNTVISNDFNNNSAIKEYFPGSNTTRIEGPNGVTSVTSIPGLVKTYSFQPYAPERNDNRQSNNNNNNNIEQESPNLNTAPIEKQNNNTDAQTEAKNSNIQTNQQNEQQKITGDTINVPQQTQKNVPNNVNNNKSQKAKRIVGQVKIDPPTVIYIDNISLINKSTILDLEAYGKAREQEEYRKFLMGQ